MTTSWLPESLVVWCHQSAAAQNQWLYISGGEVWYEYNKTLDSYWLNSTFAVDLWTSWDTTNVSVVVSTNPIELPTIRDSYYFYDPTSEVTYAYGGWPYDQGTSLDVWGFTPSTEGTVSWTIQYTKGTINNNTTLDLTRPYGALGVSTSKAFYALGGEGFQDTDDPTFDAFPTQYGWALPGMATYNFSTGVWSNETTNEFRVLGQGLSAPSYGDDGVLLFLGGDEPTGQNYDLGASLISMSDITIYDIASNSWYKQTASGTKPQARIGYCAVSVSSGNTTEIFVYGGNQNAALSSEAETDLATVHILTLPAFHWIEVPNVEAVWRTYHKCIPIGNSKTNTQNNPSQMLSIGGIVQSQDSSNNFTAQISVADKQKNGLGVFNLIDLTWSTIYDSAAPAYSQSSLVSEYYTSNSKYPTSWSDPALVTISENQTPSSSTTSTSTPTSTPTPSQPPTPPMGTSHTGAIAGGVVAGVAGIALLAGLFLWFLRRKKAKQLRTKALELMDPQSYETSSTHDPLMQNEAGGNPRMEMWTPAESENAALQNYARHQVSELDAGRKY